ncbi:MAG: septum site-determining protein MinC [Peptococcaceae bacterium]|nr:septum site-determining protein MinC [Peptococcaceae bacterium]
MLDEIEGDENTILIRRTLRSGQKFYYNGNVVVMGDVNPGAEVVATGNVIVMGQMRGMVHAGAEGDESATVMAFRLQPTQLRIANHITRPPDGEVADSSAPEIARIKNGVVTIENYPART